MSGNNRESKGLWALSVMAGAVALALVAALFHVSQPPLPQTPVRSEPGLGLGPPKGEASPALREDADSHDPTPLFLPTQWNTAQKTVRFPPPVGAFKPYPPDLVFDDKKLDLDLPPSHRVPARPADALDDDPPTQPFLGIGRSDTRLPALPPRGAFVEIVAIGTGRRVFSRALTDVPAVEADTPPDGGAWQFMAEVDAAGLIGTLVPTVRSGTEGDAFFLNYLAKTLRVGDRLSPGFYRISIGP